LKIENQENQILFRKNENSIDFDQAIKASWKGRVFSLINSVNSG
jgi:hypothetical protein